MIVFSSCESNNVKSTQEASPEFTSDNVVLQGTSGRIGIINPGFVAGKTNKYMWHFWGTKEELSTMNFKVEAINIKTGEKSKALVKGAGTEYTKTVWQYDTTLAGPNNGASAHLPSTMMLPISGVWRLDAYINNRLFDSITVVVK